MHPTMLGPSYFKKFFIAGIICLTCGLLINYLMPPLIGKFIETQIVLSPDSQSYPLWRDIPVPVYQRFYFFNVTNAQDIEQKGHKPRLEEIGPFTYRAEWSKREIEHNETQNTIQYEHFKQWHFEPDLSVADHKLQLVTINAPLAITLTLIQSASNAVRLLVTFSLDGLSDGFFTKRSVRQLLFDGYPDLLTTFGPLLNAEMLSQGGHFGYMNARNNSVDGRYQINSGVDDLSKLNTINKFNGKSQLSYWHHHRRSDKCNSLEGSTTGEMFPPVDNSSADPTLKLFQPDFCRVWHLNYERDVDPPTGLKLKRFKASRDIFRNSTDLPQNGCFFSSSKRQQQQHSDQSHTNNRGRDSNRPAGSNRIGRNRHQQQDARDQQQQQHQQQQQEQQQRNRHHNHVRQEWPAGVFTLAPCKFNAPIYLSMPHFMDADPYFLSKVDGLEPDPSKHEFYVDLEPKTGSPVTVSVRVQLNVAISKPPGLVRFRNIPEIMFPVFWQDLSVNVTGPVIDQILLASRGAQEATIKISYSFFFLGAAILITSGLFYLHLLIQLSGSSTKKEKEEQSTADSR